MRFAMIAMLAAEPTVLLMILLACFLIIGFFSVTGLFLRPGTRAVGLAILGVGGALVAVVLFYRLPTERSSYQSRSAAMAIVEPPRNQPLRNSPPPGLVVPSTESNAPSAASARPKSRSIFKVLIHTIAVALDEDEKEWSAGTARRTPATSSADAQLANPTPEDRAPARRPEWVDSPGRYVGDAYTTTVTVGPYGSRLECEVKLPEALETAVRDYAAILLGPKAIGQVRLPPEGLSQRLVQQRWEETVQTSFGPMVQVHALLSFDTKLQEQFRQQWRQATVFRRLQVAAIGLAAVLGGLGAALLFLRGQSRSAVGLVLVVIAALALVS